MLARQRLRACRWDLDAAWRVGCLSGRRERLVPGGSPVTARFNPMTMKLNKLTIVLATLALVSLAFAQRLHI